MPPPRVGSGVPTSLENSGQQWDFPNAWPPLQHVIVESLNQIGTEKAKDLAYSMVQKWIDTNYLSYMEAKPHAMFEKVRSVLAVCREGSAAGGEGPGVKCGVAGNFVNEVRKV